ncbi:MAG: hypothetical protein AB8B71_02345 [Paracoccaceae bacterium]
MKRRTFTLGLGAAVAAPTVPLAHILPTRAGSGAQMKTAALLARAHNHCTLDMLMRHLKVPLQTAREIQTRLVQQGIITAPIGGASMAVHPLNTYCVPKAAYKTSNYVHEAADLDRKLRAVLKRIDPEPGPEDLDLNTRV